MNFELMVDLHRSQKRQGPGSEEDTLRAFSLSQLPFDRPIKVVDIGCGTGETCLTLAEHTEAEILGIDLFPQFLQELEKRASEAGLGDRIEVQEASMENLNLEADAFDLIWSEGAIYNIGFEAGIKAWRKFLKPGGYLAVSEITWLTAQRPTEIENFWSEEYPEIARAHHKIDQLEENGYTLKGYFPLGVESWLNYHQDLENAYESFLDRHQHSTEALDIVRNHREEAALYRKYQEYFSYGFYIAQKDDT